MTAPRQRVYATKGAMALKAKLTVTMPPALLERVERRAQEMKVDKTTFARDAIQRHVEQTDGDKIAG